MKSIGEELQPTLKAIEEGLWEYELNNHDLPHDYPDESIRSVIKILMSVLLDRMWRLQDKEGMSIEDRLGMARKLGEEFRQMVKTYADFDTYDCYKNS